MGVGRDLMHVAMAILGLALAGLLISRSSDTSTVVSSVTGGFGDLIRTATAANASARVR